MSTIPTRRVLARRGSKLTQPEYEVRQRRRIEQFQVLSAIAQLVSVHSDVDGRASGTLRVEEIATTFAVSRKAVARALEHWRRWRVLWLFWKGDRIWDVRFERSVVDALLATSKASPRDVGQLLIKHKTQREAAAPRPIPKTPSTFAPSFSP
jgi:hypothetical protein